MPPKYSKKSKKGYKVGLKSKKPMAKAKMPSVTRISQRTFPDKLIVKLPYTDLQGFNGSGPSSSNYYTQKSYNINSLYDPETGALNQQPYGFSEYSSLFKKYRVFKVDYDIVLVNTAPSVVAGSISFARQGYQIAITDPQQLSAPYSRRFTLGMGATSGTSSAQSMKRIKGSIYLPRVLGYTPEQYRTNDDVVGTIVSNPANVAQLSINCINVNDGVQATIQADVRLTYHVEWFDRITVFGTDAPIEEV